MNHSGQMIGRIARRYASNVAIITNSTYIGLHPCQRMRFDVQDHHHRTLSSSIVNLSPTTGAGETAKGAVAKMKRLLGIRTTKPKQILDSPTAGAGETAKGTVAKMKRFVGISTTSKSKLVLHRSCIGLYVCCTEYTNLPLFIERFNVEDTFASWCGLVQLHMWMVTLRLRNLQTPLSPDDFPFMMEMMNARMWKDIGKRAGKLVHGNQKKQAIQSLQYMYVAMLAGYDEGLLTNDRVLASALWRMMLNKSETVEPHQLIELLGYVHKNLAHLETIPDDQLLEEGVVSFIPLDWQRPNKEKDTAIRNLVSMIPWRVPR